MDRDLLISEETDLSLKTNLRQIKLQNFRFPFVTTFRNYFSCNSMLIKFVIKVFAVLKILESGPIHNNIRRDKYEPAKPSPTNITTKFLFPFRNDSQKLFFFQLIWFFLCLKIYNQVRGIIIAEETDVSLKTNLRQHFWFTFV